MMQFRPAAGILVGVWARDLVVAANPLPIPSLGETRLDQVVIGFPWWGSVPAWRASRTDPVLRVE